MINIIILIFISLLTVSCSDSSSPCILGTGDNQDIITISFDDFKSQPERYRGKFIKVVGMCVRLGKHGGTTMYIVGQDPTYEIKVTAGEDIVKFSRYCEGRTMEVYGCVRGDGHMYTDTKSKNSVDAHENIYAYSKLKYYIECNKHRRIKGLAQK